MKKILSILLILLLAGSPVLAESDAAAQAVSFITLLSEGKWEDAFTRSDTQMKAALGSKDAYAALWSQLLQYGAYEGTETLEQSEGAVTLLCGFSNADITIQLAVNADGEICGMFITAVTPKSPQTDDTAQAITETVLLRAGMEDETKAVLALPEGDGPFPAVVLLHGSGPSDLNESAYGLRPFYDLASGLAELGVATLRYDKYTYAHANLITGDAAAYFTVDDEYLKDAQAAVSYLESDARVSEIYLAGHSQGAMLLPRMMAGINSEKLSGGILLCGTPKHLWEIQYDQNLAIIDTLPADAKAANLKIIEAELMKLDTLANLTDEALAKETFFGLSAYYQADEMSVDPAETALALNLPLFIAGGGKDWQVTPENNVDAWKEALGDWQGATYMFYPDMNHLLCEQEGAVTGTAADYAGQSGVSPALINDIASWILK